MTCHRRAHFAPQPAVLTLCALALLLGPATGQEVSADGIALYSRHCASCHGVSLEGQPDWKRRLPSGRLPAPPHNTSGHTWHHSDRQFLLIVRDGLATIAPGYETDMPAFGNQLSDAEIRSILGYIKSTWPDRERAYQEAKSRADPE